MTNTIRSILATKALALHLGMAACLLAGQNALAHPFDATPDDNLAVGVALGTQLGAHTSSVILGIAAPGVFGTGFEIAALATDISIKNTPPLMAVPGDFSSPPNNVATGDLSGASCVYKFQNSIRKDDFNFGVEESHASIFGVPFDPLDDVFADVGKPDVYHPHADVRVRLSNYYLGSSAYADHGLEDSSLLQQRPEFPEGRHILSWEARSSMNYVMDVTLPTVLIPIGVAAENYLAKKVAARAATASAKSGAAAGRRVTARGELIENFVGVAQEAGLITVDVTGVVASNQWYKDTTEYTAANRGTQIFTVWDVNPPYIRDNMTGVLHVAGQDIALEATDFGGVRFGREEDNLRARFTPVDNCGREFTVTTDSPTSRLFTIGDGPHELVWTAEEINGGPYPAGSDGAANLEQIGEVIRTTFTQRISVIDSSAPLLLAPASFARYTDTDIDLRTDDFPLGRPRVVDLADPSPTVTNNAPNTLEVGPDGHRYEIVWTAVDDSFNETGGTPEHTQIVTLKPPGTNIAPKAVSNIANATASHAVEIRLEGTDNEEPMIDGRFDPLEFEIETYPAAGQFEAPLLPYFIDDFRLTPVGEREEGDNLTRTSPLGVLADDFRLADDADRGAFLNDRICTPSSSNYEPSFNGTIPTDFVYKPSFIFVDDQNFYYLRDFFWVCGEGTNPGPGAEPVLSKIPRISKWTESGGFDSQRSLFPTASAAHDNSILDPTFWPREKFSVENERVWFEFDNTPFVDPCCGDPIVREYLSFDTDLGDATSHGRRETRSFLLGVAGDPNAGVLYELFTRPLRTPNFRRRDIFKVSRYRNDTMIGEPLDDIGEILVGSEAPLAGVDVKVDSKGFVYVADPYHNRIHKLSPTKMNEAGEWEISEYIGWMGRCRANKLNDDGVPFSACDEAKEVSYGYACDDLKCEGYEDSPTRLPPPLSGDQPGQFNSPQSLAISPRDILYVADTGNLRVQRFGPDGTFAGQVKSTGSGVNQGDTPDFIIGNMGEPEQVSVNSSSFYVMEKEAANGDFLVHSFKTTPFYDLTENSAKVSYVSNFEFLPTDAFSFTVNDGIDRSEPASVNISITRGFNPPERLQAACYADASINIDVPCSLEEDGEIFLRLSAYDPDGFISTGGQDSLTLEIVADPAHGDLTQISATDNAAIYRYVPDSDYNGKDTLRYRAFDGVDYTQGDAGLQLSVQAVADPVSITFNDNLRAARGFDTVLTADFSDIDNEPDRQASALSVAWGDGVVAELGNNWTGSGHEDLNGRERSPQIDFGRGRGLIVGSHNYADAGNYDFTVAMEHAPEESLPPTTATAPVSVLEVTVLGVEVDLPASEVDPDSPFELNLIVTNFQPGSWAGLEAGNVTLAFDVPEGMTIVPADVRCSAGARIECSLGTLTQGESTPVSFAGLINGEAARAGQSFNLLMDVTDIGPKLTADNTVNVSIGVADADDDGTIDIDDAFAADERYQNDTDGDGLADSWEEDYGFDPTVADDTSADTDGDGYTLLDEFLNGSSPNLAEVEALSVGDRIESPNNVVEDRIGLAMSGGDFNLDGFDDLVIGATAYEGSGAVFISYGSANGASTFLTELTAPNGVIGFGSSVAVGDWDDNDHPDIAVSNGDVVYLYFNNGDILQQPDRVIDAINPAASINVQLLSADLDNDGIDDLIVNAALNGASTQLQVYGSASGGLDAAPATFLIADGNFGTMDVGDVDGDGNPDLVLAAQAANIVRGYLAVDNSWAPGSGLQPSFELAAPAGQMRFGWALSTGSDATGDGIDDLVVGAYSGAAGNINFYNSASAYWKTVNAVPSQTIAGLDGGAQPGDVYPDQFGVSVAMGHLDTDVFADVVVGANRAGLTDEGQLRVFRGSPLGLVDDVETFDGTTTYDLLGHSVSIPGDLDGDGVDDVAGGASDVTTSQNPTPDGGYVQVLYHAFEAVNTGEDPDDDGVRSAIDNCPAVANTNQSDIDGNGDGDACDADIDGDGLDNEVDKCPMIASLDQSDFDNDLDGDLCDTDDDNDDVEDIYDAFPLNAAYNADSDSDGMPDAFEIANGLNPNDASDANADLDGDGRSNLAEFESDTNVAADDVAPELAVPADVVADSIGPRTSVNIGSATAIDVKDGALQPVADQSGPFAPGRHVITWTVSDAAGNVAESTQQIDISPQIGFVGDTLDIGEGSLATILIALNGDAANYPVTVPFTVSGSANAGVDYSLSTGDITVDNTNIGELDLSTIDDGLGEVDETLTITLGVPSNAINGNVSSFVVTISERNLAPLPQMTIEQGGRRVSTITKDGGIVIVSAMSGDPDSSDAHSFDWLTSDNSLAPQEGYSQPTFSFDPTTVESSVYRVSVAVADNGIPTESSTRYRYLRVIETAPTWLPGADSDGDGIADSDEELRDSNDNGVSDYADPGNVSHHVVSRAGGQALLQSNHGYILSLGRLAMLTGEDAMISMMDVVDYGNDGVPASDGDDTRFSYPAGLFDFEINALPRAGHRVSVVVPQETAIPTAATYRNYLNGQGWADFVVDANNQVSSAPGEPGICPAPGSGNYLPGLTAGHNCVQLDIEDGGPNDADGIANRVVRGPGGVAIAAQAVATNAVSVSVPNKAVTTGQTDVVMLRFLLNSNSSDVVLNDLTLLASGSGNDSSDIWAVRVWADSNGDGVIDSGDVMIGDGSYSADNGTLNLQMISPYRLDAGDNDFIVSYDF